LRLKTELPRLLKQLGRKDIFEPVTALWTLAELHAAEARDDVRRIVERPHEPFHGRIAEIVLAVLDGGDELIASRLRSHEHDATPWLGYAARLLATPSARGALEEVATSADEECRGFAQRELDQWPAQADPTD